MNLSIVTVCMNRSHHLLQSAPRVAALPRHTEHLVVDWSSLQPLRREQLPPDPRLRLLRVEGEREWNLCRAYNFAVAQSRGEVILKLDADAWPAARFDPGAPQLEVSGRPCAFGSGGEGRKGQILVARALFEAVGGFHELLSGYGFDDKDLRIRLTQLLGAEPAWIPADWLALISHTDAERAGGPTGGGALGASRGLATMRASRLANRLVAAHAPWSAGSRHSRYTREAGGGWRLVDGSRPQLEAETADEIDHARRMTFWSCFLAIPDIFLEELPVKLVPPPRASQWPVRWWHRLWWHSGRRLLHGPSLLLSLGRGRLARSRRPGGRPSLDQGR
jgi:hypothetical protein